MSFFYRDSKTDLKLRSDCRIKFQVFMVAQDIFGRLMVECCLLLPHNPYRVPQHYKRHIFGPCCSCKQWFFLHNSDSWKLVLSKLCWCSSLQKIFLVKNWCSFHRPVLIFQPTVDSSATDKQSKLCLKRTSRLRQNAQLQCVVIQVMLLGGGGGGLWVRYFVFLYDLQWQVNWHFAT